MKNIVSQRFLECLKSLLEKKKIRSHRQFALQLDYLPQSLSEIVKGRRDVTMELMRRAVEEFQFNPSFLMTGEGSYFKEAKDSVDNFRALTIVQDDSKEERIVHVPVPAQAGYAEEQLEVEFFEELSTFTLPDYRFKSGTHRSFDVSGDSMEPTLREGDQLVCSYEDPSFWETSLQDSYVYVIVTRGNILVKRIFNVPEKDRLQIVSDNEFYKPDILFFKNIREIWKVEVKISPFLPAPDKEVYLKSEINDLRKQIREQSRLIKNLNLSLEHHLKKSELI